MSGSVRRGKLLADMPRTPLGTSAVTCSIVQADTSFEHHSDLPRVSVAIVRLIILTSLPEPTDFSKYSIACSWLLKLLLCW